VLDEELRVPKEHHEPLQELAFIVALEDVAVDYDPGPAGTRLPGDGSRVGLASRPPRP
jgi:hypothetical protein